MKRCLRSVRLVLMALVAVAATAALSIGLFVSLALAQTPPETVPEPTTTTTLPATTTTTTTVPDSTTTTTEPDSTTTTTTAEPAPEPAPAIEPDETAHDNDIYVGTISTLTGVQRTAIEAFLAATSQLGRAQTALATAMLNPPAQPTPKTDVARAPAHKSASSVALIDSALAVDRAVKRVAFRAQETLGISPAAEDPVSEIDAARAAVDAAQADLDRATADLRAVANGDALITALLTGKPPPGDALAQRIGTAQAGQGNPPALENIFALPIPGARLVSAYGFRIDPLSGNVGFHPGV